MTARLLPPTATEYAPYYGTYIAKVPPGDLLENLERQIGEIETTFGTMAPDRATFAYAPGKWSINEVIGHLSDAERVFGYRMVSFARNDPASLPSFDENVWAPEGRFNERSLSSMVAELIAVRRASLALLAGLPAGTDTRQGTASGKVVSVRALAYILHGHVAHHLGIVRERYLTK
jgi:DinB superfamily